MLFNSIIFLFFFLPSVLIIYYVVDLKLFGGGQNNSEKKQKIKQNILNFILVCFSLLFFAWDNIGNVGVLVSLIAVNYVTGMAKQECRKILLLGVVYDLGILIRYKYLSFILASLRMGETIDLLAPLGISFIIFHCISYLMDLYQNQAEPEHNFLSFALYVTFFPKLIQGPIVKFKEMKASLMGRETVSPETLSQGAERFIVGLSKKVLIADLLSGTVGDIFGLSSYWGMDVTTAWIGCLAYTVQIYMDFSGYSDMAIGLGRMFGFSMKENFNFPYRSCSITEFWRRWHVSLGSWFRDYLYIPLGGNRRGNVYVNLFLVFLATGIWHGAGILFICWGIGHGVCVVWERYVREQIWYQRTPAWLKWAVTMVLVSIGWLTFRLPGAGEMGRYLGCMFGLWQGMEPGYLPYTWQYFLRSRFCTLMVTVMLGQAVLGNEIVQNWYRSTQRMLVIQAAKYLFLLFLWLACFVTIVATEYSPFIYFQF